jgi:predicted nucleic acid-binding protein
VKTLVIDASVVAKWFPPLDQEPLAVEARGLLEGWKRGAYKLIAPDLIWIEFANILWKAIRMNRCSVSIARATLAHFRAQDLSTVPAARLVDQAFAIATTYGRTAYDSLYVALAAESATELITADQKLANAVSGHLPVLWLGAI